MPSPSILPTPASDSPAAEQSSESRLTSCASLFRRLGAFLEFEATNIAAADHALIVDYIAANDFGHQGEIEVADFRIALGETMKHTICCLDRGQFLIGRGDRPRLIAYALQRRSDATLKAFSQDEQELCRRTFLRLTQPGEGTEDTKRRASLQELLSLSGKSTAEEDIIQKLADASLLTIEGDLTHKDAFVEVAHEALIRGWPRLRQWLDEDRAGLRLHHRISEVAQEWQRSNKEEGILYRGARLTQL